VKRYALALAAGLCLAMTLSATAHAGALGLTRIGVGAYGFSNIPIVQDDAETSALWGIKGRVGLLSIVDFEPSITFISSKDVKLEQEGVEIEIPGPDITSYLFNVSIGRTVYTSLGIGWSKIDLNQAGGGTTNETTYNFGGGVEIPAGPLAIDASARLLIINHADSASRKSLAIMAGANYYFF
jgi:hypothetical protein